MAVGLLAALFALHRRINAEHSSRAVDIVVDYNEMVNLAGVSGQTLDQVLTEMKTNGATAVGLPEETLSTLETQGEIQRLPRPGGNGLQPATLPTGWNTGDQIFTVQSMTPSAQNLVVNGLKRIYSANNFALLGSTKLIIRGARDTVSELGLGLAPGKVRHITDAGLRVIPRLRGGAGITKASLPAILDAVKQVLPATRSGAAGTVVIFDGTSIPGYRPGSDELIKLLCERMDTDGLVYGAVEFAKQKGDEDLGRLLDGSLVRVHSISLDELSTLKPSQAVQRFALAVKDRNIRVLYTRMPQVATDSPQVAALDYVGMIRRELNKEGFTVSTGSPAHPFMPLHIPRLITMLIYAGAGAGFLFWMLTLLPVELPEWMRRYAIMKVVGVLVLAALFCAVATSAGIVSTIGHTLFGLLAAVGFPLLALTWSYRVVTELTERRPAHPWGIAIRTLTLATLITLIGGLFVAAILSDARAMVKVYQFAGIKVALALPLFLLAGLMVTDGVARSGDTISSFVARCRARWQEFTSQPLYLWSVLLTLAGLVAVALLLVRSGNEGVTVSTTELKMRAMLEQFMIARPRTKEFAIGHPLFLLSMLSAARGWRTLALLLLLGGAIGQVDVLNTYCHGHTPVLLSFLRTVNGLWLGILLTLALVGIWMLVSRWFVHPAVVTEEGTR